MAHQDIRRLTNELDAAKMNNLEPSGVLPRFIQEITVSESITFFSSLTAKLLIGLQSKTSNDLLVFKRTLNPKARFIHVRVVDVIINIITLIMNVSV